MSDATPTPARQPYWYNHLRHDLPSLMHLTLCGFDLIKDKRAVAPAPSEVRAHSVGYHIGLLQLGERYHPILQPNCPACLAAFVALVRPGYPTVTLPAEGVRHHTTLDCS